MKTVDFSVPHPIDETLISGTYTAFEPTDLPQIAEDTLTKSASDAVNKRVLKARINNALKDLKAQIKAKRDEVREAFTAKAYGLDESRAKLGDRFDASVLEFANKRALRAAKKAAKENALPEALRTQIRTAKALAKSAGLDPKVILGEIQKMITAAQAAKAKSPEPTE